MKFLRRVLELKKRDVLTQYSSYFIILCVSFLITAFIARKVGPSEFSIYAAALSAGAVLGIINDFGFKQIIQRELADPADTVGDSEPILLHYAIFHSTLSSIFFGFLLSCLFLDQIGLIISLVFCFFNISVTQFISAELKGLKKFVDDGFHVLGARLLSAILIVTCLLLDFIQPQWIFLAWGTGLLLWNLARRPGLISIFPLNFKSLPYKNLLPIFCIDFLIVLYFRVDLLLLQYFGVVKTDIGNYSASLRIVEALIMLSFPLRGILLTQIRQERFNKNSGVLFAVRIGLALTFGCVMAAAVAVLAEPIVVIIFGLEYLPAVAQLTTLVWLLPPSMALAVISETVIAYEFEKNYLVGLAAVLFITVTALLIVIPFYGINFIAEVKICMEALLAAIGTLIITSNFIKKRY